MAFRCVDSGHSDRILPASWCPLLRVALRRRVQGLGVRVLGFQVGFTRKSTCLVNLFRRLHAFGALGSREVCKEAEVNLQLACRFLASSPNQAPLNLTPTALKPSIPKPSTAEAPCSAGNRWRPNAGYFPRDPKKPYLRIRRNSSSGSF